METLIQVNNLKKHFPIKGGFLKRQINSLKAVDDVSFYIKKRETLGIVGESGCGKSTTGKTLMRFHEPTKGKVYVDGEDVTKLSAKGLREKRKDMQMIFQDPYSSLNPRMIVGDIVGEPLVVNSDFSSKERLDRVKDLLEKVGLSSNHVRRFPHEFSGGQRQRIGIARAIALNPKFIVADESVSALDVSIQAQTINLFKKLQEELDLTYMFISHDLSVVKHISNRIAVMYLGKIVEMTDADRMFQEPLHPYTQALLSAIPTVGQEKPKKRVVLKGSVPNPINPPSGCVFHTRCKYKMDKCTKEKPEFRDVGNEHFVSCHLVDK